MHGLASHVDSGPSHSPVRPARAAALTALGLFLLLLGTHWATMGHLVDRWSNDPQYSHGFIVPLFAAVVLWSRRAMLKQVAWTPTWIGCPFLAIGLAMRGVAAWIDFEALDTLSLLPSIFGLVLLVGGLSVLRWSWPALAFLGFMMPLPYFMETALALPLRRIATIMSTYALQTLGCPALSEGNVILVDDIPLGVEHACSGLGMLLTFFALATALAMVVNAPWHDRMVLIASAVPIAVLANVIRITATGLAYHLAGPDSELARLIYHDLAGWLMMPLALAMLWLELQFLAHLFIDQSDPAPLPLTMPKRSEFAIELPKTLPKEVKS
ncbi:MAG: exosortase/archaeosortase family protein [Planctomycetes bacterium]|nr:exosortase/archaeosortase family protein [Planctomycetota bacterium]